MNYEVSQRHYFRENGQTLLPGQTIELTEEQAAEHNRSEPGLLKPARVTTQGHPESVRIEAETPRKTTSVPVRRRRKS